VRCARDKCENEAAYHPVLVLRAWEEGGAAEALITIPLCGHCMIQSRVKDFVNDRNWTQMVERFKEKGMDLPRRELTEVRFVDM
jgi:hypothetical protein